MTDLFTKVKEYCDSERLLEAGDKVLIGVSGGPDSMCLLVIMETLCHQRGLPLLAVHVNHMIRGAEADGDEAFVKEFCGARGIDCAVVRADIPAEAAKRQLSEEETGRIVRGEIFKRIMAERGCTKLALAHQRNDLAETMLYNMARGTGLAGLGSLRARRGQVIRPLLSATREEIEAFLRENQIPYRTDTTNNGDDHTRNRIRHHVLPYLCDEVNDQTLTHMAALSETAAKAADFIRGEAVRRLQPHTVDSEDGYIVRTAFFKEDPVIIRAGIMVLLENLNAPRRDVGRVHLEAVIDLGKGPKGRHLDLPGFTADKTREGLVLRRTTREEVRRRLGR